MGLKFSLNKIFPGIGQRLQETIRIWSTPLVPSPRSDHFPLGQNTSLEDDHSHQQKKAKPSLGEDQDPTWHDSVQLFLSITISKIVQSIGQEIRNLFLNLGRKLLIVLSSLFALLAI